MKQLSLALFLALLFTSSCDNTKEQAVDNYILYGEEDTTPEHDAVVFLYTGGGACSGTLISPTVVLTAAHCIAAPSSMSVHFGHEDPFDDVRYVLEAVTHPDYNGNNDPNDIANDIGLVRLASPAPAGITPIPPLPASLAIMDSEVESLTLNSVGYGVTETGASGTKRQMWQTLMGHCAITESYCPINIPIPDQGTTMESYMFPGTIAIIMDDNGGICHGDSGGPALVLRNGVEYVGGVHSYVIHNDQDECDYFGASTKVDDFEQFIQDFLNAEICMNGVDDDGDGAIDCDDADCDDAEDCLPSACEAPLPLQCGDIIESSTASGDAWDAWTSYNATCTQGFTVDGPEVAFALDAAPGTTVSVRLDVDDGQRDLELFLLRGACEKSSCDQASTNPPGNPEELQFTTDGAAHFIVVDTWQNEGAFTLTVECEGGPNPQEICDNGIDDDNDGAVDCDDSQCQGLPHCTTTSGEVCDNGDDDDSDGFVDCMDADCSSSALCTERLELCDDGEDNDGDGAADCDDADCLEDSACGSSVQEICDNGTDDNGDGLIDCNDPLCKTSYLCPHPLEICGNGVDDDGDRLTDCDDADCHSYEQCVPPEGELCVNGIDDDDDGLTDCEDDACASHHYCNMIMDTPEGTSKDGCTCHAGSGSPNKPAVVFPLILLLLFAALRPRP